MCTSVYGAASARRGRRRFGSILISAVLLAVGCEQEAPKSDREFIRVATELQNAGRLKDTVNELKAALVANPRNTEARWMLGQTYLTLGEGDGAAKELKRAADLGIDWAEMVVPIARSQLMQRDFDGAAATLDSRPVTSAALVGQIAAVWGDIFALKQEPAEAARRYAQALAASPVPVEAYIGDARLRFQYSDRDVAMLRLEDAALMSPKNLELICLQGLAALTGNDVASAKVAFTRVLDVGAEYDRNRRCAYRNLFAIANIGDPTERNRWRAALKREFGDANTISLLDAVADLRAGHLASAQNALESYLRRSPGGDAANFYLALAYARSGQWQQAIGPARAYRAARPLDSKGVRLEALINGGLGRFSAAADALTALLWDDPDDLGALFLLGVLSGIENPGDVSEDEFVQRLLLELGDQFPVSPYAMPFVDRSRSVAGFWEKVASESGMTPEAVRTLRSQIRLQMDAELDVTLENLQLARAERLSTWLLATRIALLRDQDLPALTASQQAQRLAPDDEIVRFLVAFVKYVTTGGSEMRAIADGLTQQFPEFVPARVLATAAALGERDFAAALGYLDRMPADHSSERLRALRVRLLVMSGDDETALFALNELVATQPAAYDLKVSIARIEARRGHWDEVKNALQNLPASYDEHKTVRQLRARSAFALGDMETAVREFQALLDASPDDVGIMETQAQALVRLGKGREAMKLAQRIQMVNVGDPLGYRLEGDVATAIGDHRTAAFAYKSANDLAPSKELVVLQSQALSASGEHDRALEVLNEGLRRYGQNQDMRIRRTETLWKAGNRELAAFELTEVLGQYPDFPGRDAVVARLQEWSKVIDPASGAQSGAGVEGVVSEAEPLGKR
ncbi:MAG: tetratricopeptide repeat protein [Gammaproteobacteria bacterium]|nr:tetratricopeptide repeat protein [Gammaproteobacteria bacterium]